MKVVIQRVSSASVSVKDQMIGEIQRGLVIFLGICANDHEEKIPWSVQKLLNLRIFEDSNRKMNLSLIEVAGSLLIISQFTLCGDCETGRRPSFSNAMVPERAELLYQLFIESLKKELPEGRVQTGQFGGVMKVSLINDGPVTFILER